MNMRPFIIATSAALLLMGNYAALAGKSLDHVGKLICATDKWDVKEPAKGHKLVDASSRCAAIPDDENAAKVSETCSGKYEYLPDGSWKGSGTCTDTYPGGDKIYVTWEEGSHLKEYPYKNTGGTGKFEGASGGGTYFYQSLSDETLFVGWYKGKIVLP